MISYFFCLETARKYAVIQIKKILNDATDVRPNITGKSIYSPDVVDGAIEIYEESRWGLNSQTGGGRFCNFDASQSNSRFGLSDSIQPYSAYTFMIIKA